MRKLTNSQKAYIAGFLDGDGSVYVRLKRNDTYRYCYQIAPYIVFYQKENYLNYFREMKKLLGIGYIRLRKDKILEYTIGDKASLIDFAEQIFPFSKLKFRQLKLLLKILKVKRKVKSAKDFIKLCEMIDKFKELNYSKKRTQDTNLVRKTLINKGLLTP